MPESQLMDWRVVKKVRIVVVGSTLLSSQLGGGKFSLKEQNVCCCSFLPHEDVENGKLCYRNLVDQPGDVRARQVREKIS